jgi:hypothetical protein
MQTKRLQKEGLRTRLRALFKKILLMINQRLVAHPELHQRLIECSKKLGLYIKLKTPQHKIPDWVGQSGLSASSKTIPLAIENMSPRARQIYAELKEAIARHQKGEA